MNHKDLPFAVSIEEIGFSDELIAALPTGGIGLVSITGLTGAGKTTAASSYAKYLREEHNLSVSVVPNRVTLPAHGTAQQEIDAIQDAIAMNSDVLLIDEIYTAEAFELALEASTDRLVIFTHHAKDIAGATKNFEVFGSFSKKPEEVLKAQRNNIVLLIHRETFRTGVNSWGGEYKFSIPNPT